MILADSVQIEELLLALKIAFLVLLYLFIWRIVRAARREVSLPQDSMLLTPDQARELRAQAGVAAGRVVIVSGARFEPRGNGVWLEDLGSTNGTYLNGIRLKKSKRLEPGDEVKVGETDLRFER